MHAWSSFVPYALAAGCSGGGEPLAAGPVAAEYMAGWPCEGRFPGRGHQPDPRGRQINSYILEAAEIQGLGFIGSTAAGLDLFAQCGKLAKNSSLNGNGKNTVLNSPTRSWSPARPTCARAASA